MKAIFTTIILCLATAMSAQKTLPALYLEGTFNGDSYSLGKLTVVDTDNTKTTYRVKGKHRGSSSKKYDKKSYNLKFQDEAGEKLDVSFFGMRSDNRWILDAMPRDISRMRNRVSFDLWNEFSAPSYVSNYEEKVSNGINGTYVEVYLNDQYNGVYFLNEKVDRKQLQLKDINKYGTLRGSLYKADEVGATLFFEELAANDDKSNYNETWESVYPDAEDDGTAHWKPLSDATVFIATSDKDNFVKEVENRVDLPVWNDYLIFLLVAGINDNSGKNFFTYVYDSSSDDKRLGICPWDLDSSWGRQSDGTKVESNACQHISNMLYKKLFMWKEGYFEALKERYTALRPETFSVEHLQSLFTKYFDLLETTGAGKREKDQWNSNPVALDFTAEKKYIFDWIEQRLAYVDSFFGYTPSGIESVLYQDSYNALQNSIFSISGDIVTNPQEGKIYIQNGKKIVFK